MFLSAKLKEDFKKCDVNLAFSLYVSEPEFFFSSRRRHTRWNCDWSSDVCSSDLRGPLKQMMERRTTGLHRFAVLTAGATFVLLFVGGLVTSTGSGLAVPDWPLSFGMVLPPMRGGVLFEHGHRLAAALVGCLTVVLALWTVVGEPRPGVRALGLTALLAVILQGVLGGVTVLYKLPLAVSVTHACLAQAFFCLTVTLALVTGAGWTAAQARDVSPRLARLAACTTGLVFVQLVLGALMRHMGAGLAIPDFPLAFGRLVPPLATPYIK